MSSKTAELRQVQLQERTERAKHARALQGTRTACEAALRVLRRLARARRRESPDRVLLAGPQPGTLSAEEPKCDT